MSGPYDPAAIRSAVIGILSGDTGNAFAMPRGAFAYGAFTGMPLAAIKTKIRNTEIWRNHFDVRLLKSTPHASQGLSVGVPTRSQLMIDVKVYTTAATSVQGAARVAQLDAIAADCEAGMRALNQPGALTATTAGAPTGIVSGMLLGTDLGSTPSWELVSEDWDNKIIESVIHGSVIVETRTA
jgi:hypothetical protein